MKRYLYNLILVLAVLGIANLGAVYTTGTSHQYVQATLGTSPTQAVGSTVYVVEITLANKTGSSATFTVTGGGTDCESGPCSFAKTVSIAANSTYTIMFNGQIAPGGVIWYASAGSTIDAMLHYRTRMSDAQ